MSAKLGIGAAVAFGVVLGGSASALLSQDGAVAVPRMQPMVVAPFSAARFAPIDPARPDGAAMAVLWGDPSAGPSAMLLKLKKGAGPLHSHTSDYHLVLVAGTAKHWAEGESEAGAAALGPGGYWFQPGGRVHGDSCLTDECLMFVQWAGKRDGKLAGPKP